MLCGIPKKKPGRRGRGRLSGSFDGHVTYTTRREAESAMGVRMKKDPAEGEKSSMVRNKTHSERGGGFQLVEER